MSTRPVARRPTPPPADQPPGSSAAASNQQSSVTLGPRDRLIGQLYIEGDLFVGGILEGEVEVTGNIEIDDMAKVKASLAGGDVNVRGHLTGPVVARKRLIVARSGSVIQYAGRPKAGSVVSVPPGMGPEVAPLSMARNCSG